MYNQTDDQNYAAGVAPPVVPPVVQERPAIAQSIMLAGSQQSIATAVVPPVPAVPPVPPVVPPVVQERPKIPQSMALSGLQQSKPLVVPTVPVVPPGVVHSFPIISINMTTVGSEQSIKSLKIVIEDSISPEN